MLIDGPGKIIRTSLMDGEVEFGQVIMYIRFPFPINKTHIYHIRFQHVYNYNNRKKKNLHSLIHVNLIIYIYKVNLILFKKKKKKAKQKKNSHIWITTHPSPSKKI